VWWLIPVVLALGRLSMILGYIATPSLKKKKKKTKNKTEKFTFINTTNFMTKAYKS
jgi:hypothetical protein